MALGPLGDDMNAGHIYVTLGRLEKAGLVTATDAEAAARPDRKVYGLTPGRRGTGRRVARRGELAEARLAEFHLKLIAAAAAGLADPIGMVDAQRRELLRRLRDAQRAVSGGGRLRCRFAPRRDRPAPAGRPALARSLRGGLDRPEEDDL